MKTGFSLIVLWASTAFAEDLSDTMISRGQNYTFDLNFVAAEQTIDSIITLFPKHPKGYFFKGSLYFYQMVAGDPKRLSDEAFIAWCEKTVDIAEKYREASADKTESEFYLGLAYGNLGRFHAALGDWIKAFYYGRKTKSLHDDILHKNQSYYDAYLSVGLYNYYAATMPKFVEVLASIFGLGGDRDLGLRQLEIASAKGTLARVEAKFLLANIFMEEGNYDESIVMYRALRHEFPNNPFLMTQEAMVHYLADHFDAAQELCASALSKSQSQFPSAEIFAHHFLGRIDKLRRNWNNAIDHFQQAVNISASYRMYKSMDGWIAGATYYQLGETYELAGKRDLAIAVYENGRDHSMSGKPTIQGCKNRLRYPLPEFEIGLIQARYAVIIGENTQGIQELQPLLKKAQTAKDYEKFIGQIYFYLGRAEMSQSEWSKAAAYFQSVLEAPFGGNDQNWVKPHTLYYLAYCYVQNQNKEKAATSLKQALQFEDYVDAPRIIFLAKALQKKI
ncbi:DUF3808 domain-containing protein [bacterium]|nr:DUF3808 domain-containing protein [bacterium]